ncbi:hypothetical protein SAMN02745121_08372 [Nannocystis exedens]|uniref:Xaa-Pro dipeptidyl-peptidase C-terminal domain-containing protein n=1 Tax=Nannocystis exedens TaxID=54 RepID=A0A1I2I1H0_9BACT|nr:CocE/NonD family hydrolase [Nannocystis exedens]PCC68483.1 hydrolase CocE/NonD family protein [Nannocystis exedens]SFF36042.1 hypothetical protein SAMN02745121_08372 [Nannocystis exedens]
MDTDEKDWVRRSFYITVRDGTRLAAYLFHPRAAEGAAAEPRPVLWTHNRYHDASTPLDLLRAWCDHLPGLKGAFDAIEKSIEEAKISLDQMPWLEALAAHGYTVAIVDVRGSGASFGWQRGPLDAEEALDAHDVTEWFAAQPWCSGKVGMFGRSYMGVNQLLAAATEPPHLRAIFPEMALFDLYAFIRGGGIFRADFAHHWTRDVMRRDLVDRAFAVDGDGDGGLLTAARAEHGRSRDMEAMFAALPFRDSRDDATGEQPYVERNPAARLADIGRSGVAVYHLAGWYDPFVRDALLWYTNLPNPQRLIIGPWAHTGTAGLDMAEEHARWYDYWLMDVDTGVMDDARVVYYTYGAPAGEKWRSTRTWPPPEARPTALYLVGGPSGTVRSVNDGSLRSDAPAVDGEDRYRIDLSTTSGRATRWTNAYGGPFFYDERTAYDEKGLTYTTEALVEDLEVTGHPIVHLWVSSDGPDFDCFAYLELVSASGEASYLTEGALRASHRRLAEPPFAALGLPYHPSRAEDIAELPDAPVELVFDLLPLSRVFPRGSRIRLTLTCADHDNAFTPEPAPEQAICLHRGQDRPSRLVLPVVAR